MKNLKEHLIDGEPFKLSKEGELKYNAVVSDPEIIKKEGGAVIYSIFKIDEKTNSAWGENRNAWGVLKTYLLNTNDIAPLNN